MSYTAFGLALDIIGVVLVGYPIAFASDKDLKAVRTAVYGAPKDIPPGLKLERRLVRIGLVFLVLGFALQLVGSLP